MEYKTASPLLLLLLVLVCIPPAIAETNNFQLSYNSIQSSTLTISAGSSSVLSLNAMYVNLSALSNPSVTIYQGAINGASSQSGTWSATKAGTSTRIGSGTYSVDYGVFSGGTYTGQLNLFWDYFSNGGYTGNQPLNLTCTPPITFSSAFNYGGADPINYPANPVFFGQSGLPNTYYSGGLSKGMYITNQMYNVSTSYYTYNYAANPALVNVTVLKHGTPTLISVYSGPVKLYVEPSGIPNPTDRSFSVLGKNLVFQSNFLGSGIVNSTPYYTDQYTLTVSPSSGLINQTYTAIVTNSTGLPISGLASLSQYALFENYGTTEYNLAKDPNGIPIEYIKVGSKWQRYSGNSSQGWISIGSTLPSSNTFILSTDPVMGTTGTRSFTAELVFSDSTPLQHIHNSITLITPQNIPTTNRVNFTIIDSTTSAAIGGSNLSIMQTASASAYISGAPWWNQTSATGKFSVSGLGSGGLQSLLLGDQIYAEGSATGYIANSLNLYIGSNTIGSTQFIALTPSNVAPAAGYFNVIYSAYDSDTTNAVSGVSIKQYCSGLTNVGITNSAGIYSTYNNSAGTCSYTASKSGYTTITKSFTGVSQQILNINIPMSPTSINPTVTATVTTAAPTVNPTATGAEGAQNAIDLLGSYAYTFMILGIFSVFMWLFWSVIYNMTGGNIITKILKRGRR